MNDLVVGIDIGTSKICTTVAEIRATETFIVGVGIEQSRGMKRGSVTDIAQLAAAVAASVHKAERASGYDISRAFINLAGANMTAINNKGATGLPGTRGVRPEDLDKAIDAARAIAIPHNRELLHVIPRAYAIDGHDHIRAPLGMHGFRLEVEVHMITVAATSIANLEQAVQTAGVTVDRFILNPLAAGDLVLTAEEREMGAAIIDIGGGTTDLAIFIEGAVWHSAILPYGGDLITNDITHWMHAPFDVAEAVKLQYAHAREADVSPTETFLVQPFGEGLPTEFARAELAMVVEARVTEMLEIVRGEVKRSGYDGLLRAGVVLTGGVAALPGIRDLAASILGLPVRIAKPDRLTGIADALRSPAFSTSVGLLRLGLQMESPRGAASSSTNTVRIDGLLRGFFKRLLPDDD